MSPNEQRIEKYLAVRKVKPGEQTRFESRVSNIFAELL